MIRLTSVARGSEVKKLKDVTDSRNMYIVVIG